MFRSSAAGFFATHKNIGARPLRAFKAASPHTGNGLRKIIRRSLRSIFNGTESA